MKIGVIYCCYGNPQHVDNCLAPWLEAKKSHDILIAAVHGQFKEYHDLNIEDRDIEVVNKLANHRISKNLDYLYIQNASKILEPRLFKSDDYFEDNNFIYQTEAEIRNHGLQWLLKQNCDYIWLLDNDEFYTIEQINNIISYIQSDDNKFYSWYSIPFKNYIFDGKQWVAGFCPPRIFKRETIRYTLDKCYWDNDFCYRNDSGEIKS